MEMNREKRERGWNWNDRFGFSQNMYLRNFAKVQFRKKWKLYFSRKLFLKTEKIIAWVSTIVANVHANISRNLAKFLLFLGPCKVF